MNHFYFCEQLLGAGLIVLLLVGCAATATATLIPQEQVTPPSTLKEVPLAGAHGIKTSGDSLWAWSENEIWRYMNGEWSYYSSAPEDGLGDMAYMVDTLWVVADSKLQYLDGDKWRELSGLDTDVDRIEADERSGILWLSVGDETLYRWDGEKMSDAGHPPGSGITIGDIAVTSDGAVWATGWSIWVDELGGLARYDDANGSWEMVRPWRSDEDIPAGDLATTPNGDLWAVLADWSEDWEELEKEGMPTFELALAYWESASGEWTVFEEGLPQCYLMVIAADDEGVWLSQYFGQDGLIHFDGETWSHYLPGEDTLDIAIAPDGTIWYIAAD